MGILNFSTKVDASKTVAEIQSRLSNRGVRKIIVDYDANNNPSALSFSIMWNDRPVFYSLPCNCDGVLKAMQKDPSVQPRFCNRDQAYRVSWRIVKDWVDAQMAIVEADIASMPEIFLPYAIGKNGEPLFKMLERDNSLLLLSNNQ